MVVLPGQAKPQSDERKPDRPTVAAKKKPRPARSRAPKNISSAGANSDARLAGSLVVQSDDSKAFGVVGTPAPVKRNAMTAPVRPAIAETPVGEMAIVSQREAQRSSLRRQPPVVADRSAKAPSEPITSLTRKSLDIDGARNSEIERTQTPALFQYGADSSNDKPTVEADVESVAPNVTRRSVNRAEAAESETARNTPARIVSHDSVSSSKRDQPKGVSAQAKAQTANDASADTAETSVAVVKESQVPQAPRPRHVRVREERQKRLTIRERAVSVWLDTRNIFIGLALVYMEQIGHAVLDPLTFILRNIGKIVSGVFHITVPLFIAYSIISWNENTMLAFAPGGMLSNPGKFAMVWLAVFFVWTVACMLATRIWSATVGDLRLFERIGRGFFSTSAKEWDADKER